MKLSFCLGFKLKNNQKHIPKEKIKKICIIYK